MADLLAQQAGAGVLPLSVGGARAAELPFEAIHVVFGEKGEDVATGLAIPAPGQSASAAEGRILWSGRGQAVLVGVSPLRSVRAVDQSDAWCRIALTGPRAEAVLARLVPLDVRNTVFPSGAVARTLVRHLPALIARVADGFEIWVGRSAARTLADDLTRAMRRVAARDAAHL